MNSTYRPEFPAVIDSTIRGQFVACPRKWFYGTIENLHHREPSLHLHFGGCWASALDRVRQEYYTHAQSEEYAILQGIRVFWAEWGDFPINEDHPKNPWHAQVAILDYFVEYPLGAETWHPVTRNGKAMTEQCFALPIPGVEHPDTGDPLLYAGRFDMLCQTSGQGNLPPGLVFVEDDKTTGQLGASWRRNWVLRGQFTGYIWGARSFGLDPGGVLIRGTSFLKRGFGQEEVIEYRPEWQIDRWLEQLRRDVLRMIQCWHDGYYDVALDEACSSYGGCPFLSLCDSPNPQDWYYPTFERRKWDPLNRVEIKLESNDDRDSSTEPDIYPEPAGV